jgi:hypothetical protein
MAIIVTMAATERLVVMMNGWTNGCDMTGKGWTWKLELVFAAHTAWYGKIADYEFATNTDTPGAFWRITRGPAQKGPQKHVKLDG